MDNEVNKQDVPTLIKAGIDVGFGIALFSAHITCGEYAAYVSGILLGVRPVVSTAVENYYKKRLEKAS